MRLIPTGLRKKISRYFTDEINSSNKIAQLEKKVQHLSILVNSYYPDKIIFNERMLSIVDEFTKENNTGHLNAGISKRDLMFHYILFIAKDINETLKIYLERGYRFTNLINEIISKYQINPQSLLDFASGHGNITRFLIGRISPENITVSDIKDNAVNFQKREFGVHGIVSSGIPEDFTTSKRFDFILVSSLFSHLNEDLFKRWLKVLHQLITPDGILLISTHDIRKFYPGLHGQEFKYSEVSEDLLFPEYEDSLTNTELYGSTYLSESYFFKLLGEASIKKENCVRYPELWGNQDLYIIGKKKIKKVNLQ